MSKKKYFTIVILSLLILLIGVSNIQPVRAQFALSSWDYPDTYGQGIDRIDLYENSTGSWADTGLDAKWDTANIFAWNVSLFIKLSVWTFLNSSFLGIEDAALVGRYLQRHNVTVLNNIGETVFSKQNFTYVTVNDWLYDPMWHYCFEVILDFLPLSGEYYTVTVIYEIFW